MLTIRFFLSRVLFCLFMLIGCAPVAFSQDQKTLKALRESGGYQHARFVDGGMSEWNKRGWPTVKIAP